MRLLILMVRFDSVCVVSLSLSLCLSRLLSSALCGRCDFFFSFFSFWFFGVIFCFFLLLFAFSSPWLLLRLREGRSSIIHSCREQRMKLLCQVGLVALVSAVPRGRSEAEGALFTSPPPPNHFPLLQGGNLCPVENPGDNETLATESFKNAIASCRKQFPDGGVVYFPGTETSWKTSNRRNSEIEGNGKVYRVDESVALADNITVLIGVNATLQFAITPSMPVQQNPECSTVFWADGGTALLCGTNLTNVAVVGLDSNSSTVDGGGWPWYEVAIANHSLWGTGKISSTSCVC